MGRLSSGKGGKPKDALWDVDPADESSLPMITSSAIELIDEAPQPEAIRIEDPIMADPAEKKFFERRIDLEPPTSHSLSSLSDPLVLAGVKSRHRLLPWLLLILTFTGAGAAWVEVIEPRFAALEGAELKLATVSKELGESEKNIDELSRKLAGLEGEKATLLAEQEELTAERQVVEERMKALEELAERLRAAFANEKRVEVAVLQDAVALRMSTDDVFVFGDVTLKDPPLLDQIGGILKGQGKHRFTIAGYTDSTPVPSKLRPRYPTNYELSAARAFAVLHQLEAQKLSEDIDVIAGGATMPLASNQTQPGRRQNRRIEILIR